MEVTYSSKKLEKTLSNEQLIKREYGKMAKGVMSRMSELRAAICLNDIPMTPPPRRHKLEPRSENKWGISYFKNYRIIFTAVGDFDKNDLSSIKEIKILELEDYH